MYVATCRQRNNFDAHCCHIGTAIQHPVPDRVKQSFVIFDIRALRRSARSFHEEPETLMDERRSARMSKITNDGLTRSGTGCFIALPVPYGKSGRQKVKLVRFLRHPVRHL